MPRRGFAPLACTLIAVVAIAGAGIGIAHAQQIWAGGYGRTPPRFATATTFDGSFNFCRVMFRATAAKSRAGAPTIPAPTSTSASGSRSSPRSSVKMVTRQAKARRPMPSSCGSPTMRCSSVRSRSCRTRAPRASPTRKSSGCATYLLKGGFLLVSDYHGSWAREQFDEQIRRALPRGAVSDRRSDAARPSDVANDVSGDQPPADGVD